MEFYKFLIAEYNEEYLDFWFDVEVFKKSHSVDTRMVANFLMNNYIRVGSANQVSLTLQS